MVSEHARSTPAEKNTLTNGWYLWDPYQYTKKDEENHSELTGLDIELTRAITKLTGKKVVYKPVEWVQHQLDLKEGTRDFASGATYTDERAAYAYFSKPYRTEENSLFIRRGEGKAFMVKNVHDFLVLLNEKKLQLGVIDGYVFADPLINSWLQDPANQSLIQKVPDDTRNIDLLMEKKIDVFIADRIAGATQIWRGHFGNEIDEVQLGIKTDIHFMFSKKTVPYSVVEKFNTAIDKIQHTNQYENIVSWYLYPVLLLQTIDTTWFTIIEILGTIAFAISGLVIAVRDRSTLFGAFVFAVLPSLGGGIIRDVIFERRPVGALESPEFLLIVVATVLVGFIAIRIYDFSKRYYTFQIVKSEGPIVAHVVLMLCDGLGLAAFTVTGIVVSVMAKASPLWLWGAFFAFLTGAGGGILRDALSKHRDIVSLRGDIYPEIAVIWGMILSLFLMYQAKIVNTDAIRYMVLFTVAGAFITRVLVFYFKIPNVYFSKKTPRISKGEYDV
jgi:polar amino acid transport system substrate-binding protein